MSAKFFTNAANWNVDHLEYGTEKKPARGCAKRQPWRHTANRLDELLMPIDKLIGQLGFHLGYDLVHK